MKAGIGLLLLALTGCANKPLLPDVQTDIEAAGLKPSEVAISIVPLNTAPLSGRADVQGFGTSKDRTNDITEIPPLHYRADALMQPASIMKVVTSSAALANLGLRWHGETQLLVAESDLANMATGQLTAPLVLRGLADYDLNYGDLAELLLQLRARGVTHLAGGVIVDNFLFAPMPSDEDREPFDEAPQAYYNYQPDALPLARNMLQIRIDSRGTTKPELTLIPTWQGLVLDNQLRLSQGACEDASTNGWQWQVSQREIGQPYFERGQPLFQSKDGQPQFILTVRGDFPRNCLLERYQMVLPRQLNLELALRSLWQQLGGTWQGPLRYGDAPAAYQVLVSHHSRPLPQLVQQMNKISDNGLAQLVFQRLADPSAQARQLSLAAAEQQVLDWLASQHVSTEGMVLDNGSGLSRSARLSTSQLAALLQANWRQPWIYEFIASLPLAGHDGTIRQRFAQSVVLNQARLKTGTLNNVTAIAGYVWDKQQRPYVFVAMVNAENAQSAGRQLINRWLEQLVQREQ